MTLDRQDWMAPADALKTVSDAFDLWGWDAAEWLMHRVEHGLLECRADLTILGDGRKFEDHEVPSKFFKMPDYGWSGRPGLPLGISLWCTGDHVHGYDDKRKVHLFGVRFHRSGIPAVGDAAQVEVSPANPAETVTKKRAAHRPEKRTKALLIYLDRLREGLCLQGRYEEARAISKAWTEENPPVPKTVSEQYLRDFHSLGEWIDGKITNAQAIIKAVKADLADRADPIN